MADNTVLPTSDGGGDTIALDDIASVKYPRSKITLGADGVNDGDVSSSNPMPVTHGAFTELAAAINSSRVDVNIAASTTLTVNSHAVTNAGTFAVQVDGNALTALQLLDDPVFADDAAFTLASSKVMMAGAIRDDSLATLTAVEGDAVPLRVSSTGALHVTGGGGGTEYTEDVATPNPIVGTATMMERDDALATLTPIEGDWAAMRCDANGALWVSVHSSALPSGAATSANQSTANTALAAIQTAVEIIDNAISGTEMQVDIVAPLPAGTNAIGKLAANDGVDIGDVDVATFPSTVHSADFDTGAGTDTTLAFGIAVPASGGAAVVPGSATDGLLVNLGTNNDVTLATLPDTAAGDLAAINAAVSGTLTVGSHAVTNAGTFAVQIDGTALTRLTDIETNTNFGAVVGGGAETTALRVTLASDSTGVLSIDDNGGAITVDNGGTFAVQAAQSGTWNITNVSGTVSLPTGAATAAKQPALGTAGSASSDVITVQGIASMTPVQITWNGTAPPIGAGTEATALRVTVATDSTGVLSVDDNGGTLTVDNGGTFAVQPTASATGGCTPFRSIDLDESEEEVKATAATLYGGVVMNMTASVLYLKFYNLTAANTTVGTSTPVMTFPIPTQGDTNGAGFTLPLPACGVEFSTAMSVAVTTGLADNDTGAPAANACVVNLFYE